MIFVLASPHLLCADWKIVTRTGDSTLTEYYRGSLKRTDSSPFCTTVLDFEHRRQVNWRNDLRNYEIVEWPPEVPPDPSGPVIAIERRTTDTGERKQIFGRTARRLISRVTRSDGPETVMDAWYVDVPGLPKQKTGSGGTFAVMTIMISGQSPAPPRIEMKQIGPVPEGLPVWQKTTFALMGGTGRTSESISEVIELWEQKLPDKFFEAPAGFNRVTAMPYCPNPPRAAATAFAEVARERWQRIQNWFATMF